jgi:hypothetical protein
MDGHGDSSNRSAQVEASGLHRATALLAVLPRRGDSSQVPPMLAAVPANLAGGRDTATVYLSLSA